MSVMIAKELAARGYQVGVLDADITGPSIPRLFHIENERARGTEQLIYPVETAEGIKVMSLNLVVEKEDEAVIWRGPAITGIVNQFWTGVYWGELDYLIIDMPPGTGDVPTNSNAINSYKRCCNGIYTSRYDIYDSIKVN